jgi:hypothetical protein
LDVVFLQIDRELVRRMRVGRHDDERGRASWFDEFVVNNKIFEFSVEFSEVWIIWHTDGAKSWGKNYLKFE